MRKLLYGIIIALICYAFYLGAFSVLHGEIKFFNDVARDFLLLQEMDTKKIVLIGPRSNTNNLFHGPLWTYINYPVYVLGNGNPLVNAWYWLLLEALFLFSSFWIVKRLFGTFPAFIFVLMMSVRFIPHINGVFHAEATIFVIPVLFFTIYEYVKTRDVRYLISHFIAVCVLTQLNIGVGVQFIVLSSGVALYAVIRYRQWKHLIAFLIIPAGLINFILFDIKHQLQMTKALIGTGASSTFFITLSAWIHDRINNIISMQLVENAGSYQVFLFFVFIFVMIFSFMQIKNEKKERLLYIIFLYYYFGYIGFSYFNKGILLFHYVYLLIPFTLLWVVSFLRGKYTIVFVPVVIILFIINLQFSLSWIDYLQHQFMGKDPNSWIGLSRIAKEITKEQSGKEFGYFVYSPDAYAYQPRYAMIYNFKAVQAKAFEYGKRFTTFVIAQAPPADNPYMGYEWWVEVPAGIKAKAVKKIVFPNGYTLLSYHLSPEEQKVPHDKNIELGIHFR